MAACPAAPRVLRPRALRHGLVPRQRARALREAPGQHDGRDAGVLRRDLSARRGGDRLPGQVPARRPARRRAPAAPAPVLAHPGVVPRRDLAAAATSRTPARPPSSSRSSRSREPGRAADRRSRRDPRSCARATWRTRASSFSIEWLDVFTPDVEYSAFGTPYTLERFPALLDAAPRGQFIGNMPVVEFDGDRATGVQHFVFIDQKTHDMRLGLVSRRVRAHAGRLAHPATLHHVHAQARRRRLRAAARSARRSRRGTAEAKALGVPSAKAAAVVAPVHTAPQSRIIEAALALFAEHGISGTSLQMIATRSA